MRTQETFQAWLTFAQETRRLSRQAKTRDDYDVLYARDERGAQLWQVALADGWTVRDAERAFGREVGAE